MSEAGELGMFLALGAAALGLFFGPISAAIAKRISGAAGAKVLGELEDLRQRLHELEGQQERLLELEERVEFAERLLARREEEGRIGPG